MSSLSGTAGAIDGDAADQSAAWSGGRSQRLYALELGHWQPPPSPLMWGCKKLSRACWWLWCFDYPEARSCRSVQLVLWMSFDSSAWLPPLFPSTLAPGRPAGPRAGEKEAATGPRGPYQRMQPWKVNIWSQLFKQEVAPQRRFGVRL